jgi:ring-1,2-phenylacetyl-CoA epoxidase subunit PaaE
MDLLNLQVKNIIAETSDSKTFILEEINQQKIKYEAGQFLTFLIQANTQEIRRSYSLSSSPLIDKYLAITIKRVENGLVSRDWLEHLQVGDILQSLVPTGRFTLETNRDNQRDIFFIAAGSGITPIFSLLKKALNTEPQSKITLIYANKKPSNTIFYEELERLSHQLAGQFKLIHLFSQPTDNQLIKRLGNSLLEKLIAENQAFNSSLAQFYICGPTDLMRMTTMTLKFMGYTSEQIHKENFVVGPVALPQAPYSEDISEKKLRLHWQSQIYEMPLPYNLTILQAALNQGLNLPYSCKAGRCAACEAKCVRGDVKMSINEVLTEKEVENGFILTCVSYGHSQNIEVNFDYSID